MYTLDAIILEIQHIRDKHIRIVCLTEEYGKITVWYTRKTLTGVDIGDIAQMIIERKGTKNTLKYIQTRSYLIQKNWNYTTLIQFLEILKMLRFYIGEHDIQHAIFTDYVSIFLPATPKTITTDQCLLLQIRMLKRLGHLDPQFFSHHTILQYIYKNITTTPLSRILASKDLDKNYRKSIQSSYYFAINSLSSVC